MLPPAARLRMRYQLDAPLDRHDGEDMDLAYARRCGERRHMVVACLDALEALDPALSQALDVLMTVRPILLEEAERCDDDHEHEAAAEADALADRCATAIASLSAALRGVYADPKVKADA